MSVDQYKKVQGSGQAVDATPDVELIAAVTGKIIRLKKAIICVNVVADGGGEVALEDGEGGTRFFEADADALGVYRIDFGEEGWDLTTGNALNLTVDGATTDATATCTAIAVIV